MLVNNETSSYFIYLKIVFDSNISHDEFISINNLLKEFYDMETEMASSSDK